MGKRKNVHSDGAVHSREYNFWDSKHDGPFVECLLQLAEKGQIVAGTCKNGVFNEIERMMEKKVPGCGLKAKSTIRTRIKKLKKWFHATVFMRNQSGFGWDSEKVCIDVENDVWEPFVKVHTDGKGYNRVPFPHFFALTPVFGKGRATGDFGFSGHDPNISEDGINSSDDEESPFTLDPDQLNAPEMGDAMLNMINEGVEASIRDNRKRAPSSSETGLSKKKKKGLVDDRIVEGLKEMRPLIMDAVGTIAKALGGSEEHNVMRQNLLQNLEKINGLSRVQMILACRRLKSNPEDLQTFYELEEEEDKLTLVLDLLSN